MRKTERLLLAAALVSGLSLNALAGGARAGGGDHRAAGPACGSQALDNSNGRRALDRDKGLDRAEDRQSPKARKHEGARAMRERRSEDTARERTYLM